jgi:hypothetical protein
MLQKDMIPPLKGSNYVGHEDGGSKFFRNFGTYRQYYAEWYIDIYMYVCIYICIYGAIAQLGPRKSRFWGFYVTHNWTHTHTHSRARPVRLLWASDQIVTQAATYTIHTKHRKGSSMTSACFERSITTITRSQAYGVDRVAMICRE